MSKARRCKWPTTRKYPFRDVEGRKSPVLWCTQRFLIPYQGIHASFHKRDSHKDLKWHQQSEIRKDKWFSHNERYEKNSAKSPKRIPKTSEHALSWCKKETKKGLGYVQVLFRCQRHSARQCNGPCWVSWKRPHHLGLANVRRRPLRVRFRPGISYEVGWYAQSIDTVRVKCEARTHWVGADIMLL